MNKEQELERQIQEFVNMDLSRVDAPSDGNVVKLYVPGTEVLMTYMIGQVSSFLFEETIASIRAQIFENGVLFGMRSLSFEIFKYFFRDKNNLARVQNLTPTFLRFFLKYATVIPDVDMNDVSSPSLIIENVKNMIMSSDKPFKVDVNAIISFSEMNKDMDKAGAMYDDLNESVIRRYIRQSIKKHLI